MPVANPDRQSGGGGLGWLPGYLNPVAAPAAPTQTQQATNPFDTDPAYLAALAAEQQGIQAADAALRAAQEQAIVGFGDPGLADALGISVSPQTRQAAEQNPHSTVKRLGEQRDEGQRGIVNNLAAHGILFSGDLGYKTGENQKQYARNVYDQQQSLLGSLGQIGRDTLAQKQTLHQGTVSALEGAYTRAIQNPYGAAPAQPGSIEQSLATTPAPAPARKQPVSALAKKIQSYGNYGGQFLR